ncbi:MAG: hypothetical protein IT384_06305 [Deltaproteobacteria bacterium]|nr:hypothetical protein [Deltaproteobacteria bacterium]
MSDSGARLLHRNATLDGGPAGSRWHYSKELQPFWAALRAKDAEVPEKPAGQITEWGLESIKGLKRDEILRSDGKPVSKVTFERLQKSAERLVWRPEGPNSGAIQLTPAHAALPVFINSAGWAVPRADIVGQPQDLNARLAGVYGLEEAMRRQLRINRHSLGSLLGMSLDTKRRMANTLSATADTSLAAGTGALPGLDKDQTMELRSSAFTTLMGLAVTLDRSTAATLIDTIHTKLGEIALKEPDQLLGEHMARMLNHPTYLAKLKADDKTKFEGMTVSKTGLEAFELRFPQKVEIKNIIDADGYLRWEHVTGQGENFFESYKHTAQVPEIHGAQFKLVAGSETWNSFDLQLDFATPHVVDGMEIKGIKKHVRLIGEPPDCYHMLGRNIGTEAKPVYQGGSYGGHSQIGEVAERSRARAVQDGRVAVVDQPYIDDRCAGLDNYDDNRKSLGKVDINSTYSSSFFRKGAVYDATGKKVIDEGVTHSEGQDILFAYFRTITQNGAAPTRSQVDAAFREVIDAWQHPEPPNTIVGTLRNVTHVLSFHEDKDGDGVMDARDIHFHCGLRSVAPDLEHEYTLKPLPEGVRADRVKGSAAKDSVLDMNVATHYNSLTHNEDGIQHKFVADGFWMDESSKDLMRFSYDEVYPDRDGRPVKGIMVQTNPRLAHISREAHEGLTMYLGMLDLADRGAKGLEPGIAFHGADAEVDKKLMALTFAAFRLNYDGKPSSNDTRIWRQLLQVLRLPEEIPYRLFQSALDGEHHDYAGNMQIVNAVKAQLGAAVVAELRKPQVGRPEADGPSIA